MYSLIYKIKKQASAMSDYSKGRLSSMVTDLLTGLGTTAEQVGNLVGFIQLPPDLKKLRDMLKHKDYAWIPGVGGFRTAQRRTGVTNIATGGKRKRSTALSLVLGSGTSMLAGTALGTLIGGLTGGLKGALLGTKIGLTASSGAMLIAGLISLMKDKRTKLQQIAYLKKPSTLMNYLIPGVGVYNYTKGLGASDHWSGAVKLKK